MAVIVTLVAWTLPWRLLVGRETFTEARPSPGVAVTEYGISGTVAMRIGGVETLAPSPTAFVGLTEKL